MAIKSKDVVSIQAALAAKVPIEAIIATTGYSEDEIKLIDVLPDVSHCEVLESVQEDLLLEGEVQEAVNIGDLDSKMTSLASRIVDKMETFTLVANNPVEVAYVVEALATLRQAFYGKGATVNIQNNMGGGGGEGGGGSRFQTRLKR